MLTLNFCIRFCRNVKNISMRKIIQGVKYYTDRRFTTLSGTLVYFLLMSVTPFLFSVALIVGNVDLSGIISAEIFSAIQPVLEYLQQSANNATVGASVVLAVTSLWSSTNFFYHLRRSGEIIFAPEMRSKGLKLRFFSLMAVLGGIMLVALIATVPFIGYGVLENIMPSYLAEIITITFISTLAFVTSYFLNVFACPYRLFYDEACGGAILTLILWIIFGVGFSVYLRFANIQKLYGAVTAVIIFLLWCYLMINSLVIGMIYNAKNTAHRRKTARLMGLN